MSLRGNLRRYMDKVDNLSPECRRVERMVQFQGTVDELVTLLYEAAIPRGAVKFTGSCHLLYPSVETEAERDHRVAHYTKAAERQEEWERATYLRLRDKYGDTY